MDVLAIVFIKSVSGREHDVRGWMQQKSAAKRYCVTGRDGIRCAFCGNEELEGRLVGEVVAEESQKVPCEAIEVLVSAYITGPFDFVLVLRAQQLETVEHFVVSCIRGWELAGKVSDTQTVTGVLHFPAE